MNLINCKPEFNTQHPDTMKGHPMTDTPPLIHPDPAPAAPLWTVKDAAAFLRKSPRWIFYALQTPEHEAGSIPHAKLGRNPRFIPDDLHAWAAQGFPPAAAFKTWKDADERRRRRAG